LENQLPLHGIRIVEFTWVIAGPMMTRTLAMLGAEVVRVESAKRAEFRARDSGFGLLNNNKKSCSLDLSTDLGREVARDLVSRCDIVVENFSYGVMDKLGLGYEAIRKVNPNVIMLSCSGMGRTGPGRTMLAYGTLLQLNSGWSSLQGGPDSSETVIGGAWTDPLTAATGSMILMAALYNRRLTGEGQYVDLSMVEATMCGVPNALLDYALNRRIDRPTGNRDVSKVPHGCYPCRGNDRWVVISVGNEAEWQALVHAMGDPVWANESRFMDKASRKLNETEIDEHIARWTTKHSAEEIVERLRAHGVAATVSLTVAEVVNDKTLQERGYFHRYSSEYGSDGSFALGLPWVSEPCLDLAVTPAPALGQDNSYVLECVLGYSRERVAELDRGGALF